MRLAHPVHRFKAGDRDWSGMGYDGRGEEHARGRRMIPILVVAGLIIGFLPRRWPIVGVVAIGIGGTLLFASDDLLSGPLDAFAVFAIGAINAAAGAFVAWLIKRLISTNTPSTDAPSPPVQDAPRNSTFDDDDRPKTH